MKTWQAIVFGCFIGLISSGIILFIALPPRGIPVLLLPTPTPMPYVVHISGAVHNPGVYSLPPGSRIIDLIQVAGGLLPDADADSVNQAAKLFDGQKIVVSRRGTSSITANSETLPVQYPLNINFASQKQLESLPGIGPTKALDIISYREKNGYYKSVDELLNVPGIGLDTLNQIRELISVQ